MKSKLNYGLLSLVIVFAVLLVSCFCINFEYIKPCAFIVNDTSNSLVVDKKINNYITKHNVIKVSSNINNQLEYFYLYYQTSQDDSYIYWANPSSSSFALNDGTYSFSIDFGKISFISYII